MDDLALQLLTGEMRADVRVALEAHGKAAERYARGDEIGYEACAHQLSRLFNICEQMALRTAKAFENNIDDEKGWHSALLTRLALDIPGVRPALIPEELRLPLNELKAFRHVIVHAYDLQLDPDKLALLMKYAAKVAERLPQAVDKFLAAIAAPPYSGT